MNIDENNLKKYNIEELHKLKKIVDNALKNKKSTDDNNKSNENDNNVVIHRELSKSTKNANFYDMVGAWTEDGINYHLKQ